MDNLAPIEQLRIMPTQRIVSYFTGQQTEGTARTYLSTLKSFFAWTNGQDYRTITPFQALDYDAYLKQSLAPATVQRQISTLTRFFGFAHKCGLIENNPFAVVKQKGVSNTANQKFLTAKELDRLLSALREQSERDYLIGLLLAATGMRISELQHLSWCDFVSMPDGSISINALRKGNERQLLPLRKDVWKELQKFMGKEIDQTDKSPLFLNPSGNRISSDGLRDVIEKGAKRAKIKKNVTPHVLRHSFCTLSLANGASLRDVQEYANHKQISTTQRYLHADNLKVGEFMPIKVHPEA